MTPSRDSLALCVDLGTSGLKVGLVTLDGRLHSVRHATVSTDFDGAGGATQDAGVWWEQISAFCRSLCAEVDSAQIAAVAVTGQYASSIPVNEAGEPVGACVLWMDTRGGRRTRAAVGGPVAGLRPRAALAFVRKTGGAPSPSGADGTGSMLHLIHDEPEIMKRTRWILEPVDYLTMRFSGQPSATHASMIGSWLTDNRRLDHFEYDPGLCALLGVDKSLLAPLLAFGSIAGAVTAEANRATGIPEGTPVLAGSPDLHAAALGSGTTELGGPGHLALSTTSWVSAPMAKKKTDILHSIATMPGLDDSSYLIVNNHEVGAKALEWYADALGVPRPVDFDALTDEAASSPNGSGSVIFTPWLAGERSPVESHSARGGFHNLSLGTSRADMIRAVLEGVAYNSRWLADYVDRFASRKLAPLRLVGGGATSTLWCQIHADVMNREIDQIRDPVVAQLRGIGILAGRTLGVVTDDEIPSLAQIAGRFDPDPDAVAVYDRLFAEFPGLLKVQRPMFKRLQGR